MDFLANIKGSIQRWWLTGAIVGALAWVFAMYIFPQLPGINITFSTIDVPIGQQHIPSFGQTILNFFKFQDPTPMNFLTSVLSGIVLVVLGRFVYSIIPAGKSQYAKLAYVLGYGAILGTVVLSGIAKFPFGIALMVMGIYYLIIAISTVGVARLLKVRIPE